eukprot:gnl/MRDRNA2_/MRDRNA2_83727_c0_seq1.p1 gnl/MRDRNA2_/MRDRNA2_83727_c0~~gnl/MRDRNA2_/MRDRNA2_83727_c0_seq1.p1  ORF type:complete len:266 (-),score=39.81 gnl/MRDRNA2_/MRDRNA2_83727_c0_seq1:17-814(-)
MSNSRIGASTCLVLVAILKGAGADPFQDAEVTVGAKGSAMLRRTGLADEHKTVSESVATLKSIQRSIDPAAMLSQESKDLGSNLPHHNYEGTHGTFREHHDHTSHQLRHESEIHAGSAPTATTHYDTGTQATGVPPKTQQRGGQDDDYYYYYEEPHKLDIKESLNWKAQPDTMVPLPHQLDNHIAFPLEMVAVMGQRKECMKTDEFTKLSAHLAREGSYQSIRWGRFQDLLPYKLVMVKLAMEGDGRGEIGRKTKCEIKKIRRKP